MNAILTSKNYKKQTTDMGFHSRSLLYDKHTFEWLLLFFPDDLYVERKADQKTSPDKLYKNSLLFEYKKS